MAEQMATWLIDGFVVILVGERLDGGGYGNGHIKSDSNGLRMKNEEADQTFGGTGEH